jgi:hypothetical protein
MHARTTRYRSLRIAVALALCAGLAPVTARAQAGGESPRFEGESRCGNPTCHGAGLPTNEAQKKNWKPWKSARSQWLNRNIDHHSRAYATLETSEAKAIAGYMGIDATASEKCLVCHAPAAVADPKDSRHQRKDGVSCEHCHGPSELWLKPHVEKDWKEKKAQFAGRGFYDNANFKLRAEKCASCHVEIDHEIIAGGHPPLQFELVAYAQIMKHWDDQDKLPPGTFSPDPTLWSIGQVVGLRRAAQMIARRAGDANYQSIKKFSHFEDKNCYQCHHKLVEDAVRQAQGHYDMVDVVMASLFSGQREELAGLWNELASGVRSSAEQAQQRATALEQWLAPFEQRIAERSVDREMTKKFLERITSSGEKFKAIRRFSYSRPPTSNTTRIDGIGEPWWYTTGAPEQTILAIQALCEPAFPGKCGSGPGGIEGELRKLLAAVDRFDYRPDQFAQSLGAINKKLFR